MGKTYILLMLADMTSMKTWHVIWYTWSQRLNPNESKLNWIMLSVEDRLINIAKFWNSNLKIFELMECNKFICSNTLNLHRVLLSQILPTQLLLQWIMCQMSHKLRFPLYCDIGKSITPEAQQNENWQHAVSYGNKMEFNFLLMSLRIAFLSLIKCKHITIFLQPFPKKIQNCAHEQTHTS